MRFQTLEKFKENVMKQLMILKEYFVDKFEK